MPIISRRILEQLQVSQDIKLEDAEIFGALEINHQVGKPEQLFPRIEVE